MNASVPPGLQDTCELGQRGLEVGDVMQDRVPEHEVERLVLEGQGLGVGADRRRPRSPSRSAEASRTFSMPGGDVGRGRLARQSLCSRRFSVK